MSPLESRTIISVPPIGAILVLLVLIAAFVIGYRLVARGANQRTATGVLLMIVVASFVVWVLAQ